jgi:hypothetical protein
MIHNDRQTGPAEEGEARLASPSSQSSVQQNIPDEVRGVLLSWLAKGNRCSVCSGAVNDSAQPYSVNDAKKATVIRAFLAGSTVSGQGEEAEVGTVAWMIAQLQRYPLTATVHSMSSTGHCNFQDGEVWMAPNGFVMIDDFTAPPRDRGHRRRSSCRAQDNNSLAPIGDGR